MAGDDGDGVGVRAAHQPRGGRQGTLLDDTSAVGRGGRLLLAVFVVVRWNAGYGDMFLHRADNSWQQWLHVSKYPPSLTYAALELGLTWLALAWLMRIEPVIGVRPNGVFLVFGQTAMFFYMVHRLAFEIPATYFGLRGVGTTRNHVLGGGADARRCIPHADGIAR